MIDKDDALMREVRLSLLRARHNELADVEVFCTGTSAKLERYEALLIHVAKRKDRLRCMMRAITDGKAP